uniref:Uncharacterized protein n=1 Tax=Triticum urartu TaxID=4572 RepID=A0A8R7UQE6_TRIUA
PTLLLCLWLSLRLRRWIPVRGCRAWTWLVRRRHESCMWLSSSAHLYFSLSSLGGACIFTWHKIEGSYEPRPSCTVIHPAGDWYCLHVHRTMDRGSPEHDEHPRFSM